MNPELVLEGEFSRLIDEWQEVPAIWDAIRGKIDESTIKGQFILTGSVSINKDKYIYSGTGRIARLRMRPMSLFENGKSTGQVSLCDICYNRAKDVYTNEVNLDTKNGVIVAREYVKGIINEDIYKVDDIKRDKHKIELLLRSFAHNEATTVTNSTLKKDINDKDLDDINIDTISDYLNLFNNMYITENIAPFSSKLRSSLRVKQSEKRHFVDSSIPFALLNLTRDKLLNDLELLEFLFELLVERDLLTYVDSFNAKLYHYQDYKNNKIDAIIELEDGSWCGVEIKLVANQIDEAAKNLVRINNQIEKEGGMPAKSLIVICG